MSRPIGLFLSEDQLSAMRTQGRFMSCSPKERIEKIKASVIPEHLSAVGEVFAVANEAGKIVEEAKLVSCFITTYGKPDMRLVVGMGFGTDVELCKRLYAEFWKQAFPKDKLSDSTELFVSDWELVK